MKTNWQPESNRAMKCTRVGRGGDAVPEADPQWNYQLNSIDRDRWDHIFNCLIEGMKTLTVKPVNYEKVKEVQQGQDENPAVFQRRLVEAFRKYVKVDPSSPRGQALLTMHFIAQSAADIRRKIQKATAGAQTPVNNLLQLAYSVFNNMDVGEKVERTQRNIQKCPNDCSGIACSETTKWEAGFSGLIWPWQTTGPWVPIQGQCTLCGTKGHWRENCGRGALCKQPGHWKRECPRCQRATVVPQPLMVSQSED